jgi:uncharacterized membrane protein
MRHQEASATVAAPVERVEQFLADVDRWPTFLVGLESVRRLAHERYLFALRDGREQRDVTVAVRRDHAAHKITWRALDGPTYTGCFAVRAVDTEHTQVRLEIASQPGTLVAGIADMIMPRSDRAVHDLQALQDAIAAG